MDIQSAYDAMKPYAKKLKEGIISKDNFRAIAEGMASGLGTESEYRVFMNDFVYTNEYAKPDFKW